MVKAKKKLEKPMPIKTTVDGLNLAKLDSNKTKPKQMNENNKANKDTSHGLWAAMVKLPIPASPTPLRAIMPTLAPKEAAFEIPKVAGEAIGFFKTDCMSNPDNDKAAPTTTAPRLLGSLIFWTMEMVDASPTLNNPFQASNNPMLDEPTPKEKKKSKTSPTIRIDRLIMVFLLFFFRRRLISFVANSIGEILALI